MKLDQFKRVHPKLLQSNSSLRKFGQNLGKLTSLLVFSYQNDQKSPKNWSKVQGSTATQIQPNLFKFSVSVVQLNDNLWSTFRSSTSGSCHTRTPLSPNSGNCSSTQSLGQNISNGGACFKKRSMPFKRWDFIPILSAKKSLGTHWIIPQEAYKDVVHTGYPRPFFSS